MKIFLKRYSYRTWILLQMPAVPPRVPLLSYHISMSASANNHKDIIVDYKNQILPIEGLKDKVQWFWVAR